MDNKFWSHHICNQNFIVHLTHNNVYNFQCLKCCNRIKIHGRWFSPIKRNITEFLNGSISEKLILNTSFSILNNPQWCSVTCIHFIGSGLWVYARLAITFSSVYMYMLLMQLCNGNSRKRLKNKVFDKKEQLNKNNNLNFSNKIVS